jgi:signal transduction histidine kinase
MKTQENPLRLIVERVLPWFVLAVLLTYTYAKFFRHSYGFRVDSSTASIVSVFERRAEPTLRVNDQIVRIGSVAWEEFQADLRRPFFEGYQPGEIVPLTVARDGQEISVRWKYPTFSRGEFLDQLNSEWWLAYFFWLAGVLTILLVRPKDTSWLLMALFNFLTAIWLIAGSGLSAYHIGYSAIVLRVAVWLCVPVYLHLHWVFPHPLRRLSPWLIWMIYGIAIIFAVMQALQLLPSGIYVVAFAIALSGSLLLLFIHIWRQPTIRRDFRLLLVVLILAVAPSMFWAAIESVADIPAHWGAIGLLSLPLLPLAYLYTAFRRRLSYLELRANSFFTIFIFLILLGLVGLPLIALGEYTLTSPDKAVLIGSAAAILTTIACLWGYPAFSNFMDRYILGISVTSKHLLESFSTQITTSVSLPGLIRVLHEEVFPSLLIRQFAFLQCDQGSLTVLSIMGLDTNQLPFEQDVSELISRSGFYRAPDPASADRPYSWIRLVLSLRLGDEVLGFWLLGRRDPDDHYSQQEIPVLSSLANLTAIALSNILQTARLKAMYEANIGRYEQERLRLARDLHDSILNEMAALLMRSDAPVYSPEFQKAFEALTERLREIVSDLRPPMLNFGLKYALEELAEKLSDRHQNLVTIEPHLHADGDCRYPNLVENHTYRIVQESCENALKYARANTVKILAELSRNSFEINVEDDGIGFQMETNRKLDEMLARKHFGLVGMLERANLIGAEIDIDSKPGAGTRIRLRWKSKEPGAP